MQILFVAVAYFIPSILFMHNKAPLKSAQLLLLFGAGVVVAGVIVVVAVAAVAVAVAAAADAAAAAPLAVAAFGNFAICMPSCRHSHTNRRQSGLHMGPGPTQQQQELGARSRGKDKRQRCDRQTLHGVQVPARL